MSERDEQSTPEEEPELTTSEDGGEDAEVEGHKWHTGPEKFSEPEKTY